MFGHGSLPALPAPWPYLEPLAPVGGDCGAVVDGVVLVDGAVLVEVVPDLAPALVELVPLVVAPEATAAAPPPASAPATIVAPSIFEIFI